LKKPAVTTTVFEAIHHFFNLEIFMITNSKVSSLSAYVEQTIEELLMSRNSSNIEVQEIWGLMDKVWDELECNNQNIDQQKLNDFYNHPIWLLNGLFIEQHPLSMQHRRAIANWINENCQKISSVIDFGGGFGTLARLIAKDNENISIDICEPHPNPVALEKIKEYANINFIDLPKTEYDCLVCTDVLEHVSDPLDLLAVMIGMVKINGYLIIANCFYPDIKCHLPSTFHLRYTFDKFAQIMGLEVVGICQGSHGTIYIKSKQVEIAFDKIRKLEKTSKFLFPFLILNDYFRRIFRKIPKILSISNQKNLTSI
jgi:2-polyprenyl-3-methyl-5-hydroxy-6-metoxy-1,4-benzoquinol methylase